MRGFAVNRLGKQLKAQPLPPAQLRGVKSGVSRHWSTTICCAPFIMHRVTLGSSQQKVKTEVN